MIKILRNKPKVRKAIWIGIISAIFISAFIFSLFAIGLKYTLCAFGGAVGVCALMVFAIVLILYETEES